MKTTIVFSLPEENYEFILAINASKMYCTLWELDQWLRSEIKRNGKDNLEPIREKLRELMNENSIDFDMFE